MKSKKHKKDFTQFLSSMPKHLNISQFKKFWEFKNYTNPHEPLVVFGFKAGSVLKKLLKHKGEIILIPSGRGDFSNKHVQSVLCKLDPSKILVLTPMDWESKVAKELGLPSYNGLICTKNFSSFQPSPKGDKIYFYLGKPEKQRRNKGHELHVKKVYEPLVKYFGKNKCKAIFKHSISEKDLKKIYEDSFIHIKGTDTVGNTGMFELGHMGRKTITCGWSRYPSAINIPVKDSFFKGQKDFWHLDLTDKKQFKKVIKIIEREEKKVGMIDKELSERCKNTHLTSPNWLTLKTFYRWKKKN